MTYKFFSKDVPPTGDDSSQETALAKSKPYIIVVSSSFAFGILVIAAIARYC